VSATIKSPTHLGQELLHESNVGRFGLHELQFPNGHKDTLVLLEHPGAAAVVPFLDADRIVLLRQYRLAANGVIWEIPAGKLDPGEAPLDCARRELAEETGYRASRLEAVGSILTAPGFTDERIHLFCAFDLEAGDATPEPNELIEIHEVPLERALEMVASGEIIDAKTVTGLFHASRLLDSTR